MSSSGILEEIYQLKKSSANFADQLNSLLHREDYIRYTKNLGQEDTRSFVGYLDEALGFLDPSSPAARKCLRELKTICGVTAQLPASFIIPTEGLQVEDISFASGGFADVFKGTFRGAHVSVKRVRVSSQDPGKVVLQEFCKEAVMWKYLNHRNILHLLAVTISPPQLISDWMPGGDLPEYIRINPMADRVGFIHDVARGLDYLHSRNVIHGGLMGINILVDITGSTPFAVIADFGVAIVTRNIDSMRPATRQNTQSPRWSAPEVLGGQNPSTESDVYSFAMVTVEVLTGDVPFGSHTTVFTAAFKVMSEDRPPKPLHRDCTERLWGLIQRCWSHDAKSRPAISEVLQILVPSSHR